MRDCISCIASLLGFYQYVPVPLETLPVHVPVLALKEQKKIQRKQQKRYKVRQLKFFKENFITGEHNFRDKTSKHMKFFFIHKIFTEDKCGICFDKNNDKYVLRCGHIFHNKCIETWISQSKQTCPLCISNIM